MLTTLLTKYSTTLQIQYHEEQDIMSTPWLWQKKKKKKSNEAKLHRTIPGAPEKVPTFDIHNTKAKSQI